MQQARSSSARPRRPPAKNCSTAIQIISSAIPEWTRCDRVTICTPIKAADIKRLRSRRPGMCQCGEPDPPATVPALPRPKSPSPRLQPGLRGRNTKLRAAGHLPSNAADVSERFVQVVHMEVTLHCKVYLGRRACQIGGKMNDSTLFSWPS